MGVRVRWRWLIEWHSLGWMLVGIGSSIALPVIAVIRLVNTGDPAWLIIIAFGPALYVLIRWRDDGYF